MTLTFQKMKDLGEVGEIEKNNINLTFDLDTRQPLTQLDP